MTEESGIRFAAAFSDRPEAGEGVEDLTAEIRRRLAGKIDLALLFACGHDANGIEAAAALVRNELSPGALVGCTAEGVIAPCREIERLPGMSLLAGRLPGAECRTFRVRASEWPDLLTAPHRMAARIHPGPPPAGCIMLADPFSTPIQEVLRVFAEAAPGVMLTGGMASGGAVPGANRLIADDDVMEDGAVGVTLAGAVRLAPVVSQGCRAIGPVFLVTAAETNLIRTLNDRPALEVLRDMARGLTPADLSLVQQGLFVGVTIEELADPFGRGDVLVRGVLGADRETGALAINERIDAGRTVQFFVRDADSADAELRSLLARTRGESPAAGLVFSCNGRGTRMFPDPHHDARSVDDAFPRLPIGGFFAMGEIGAVGGIPFLHGHTASIALILPP